MALSIHRVPGGVSPDVTVAADSHERPTTLLTYNDEFLSMVNSARNLLQTGCVLILPVVLFSPTTVCAQVRGISNELGTNVEEPAIKGERGIEVIPVKSKYADPLANTVQAAIDSSSRRTLSTDVHTPWQIMHALLGLRKKFKMDKRGRKVNGLEWISNLSLIHI